MRLCPCSQTAPVKLHVGFVQNHDQREIEQSKKVLIYRDTPIGVVGSGDEQKLGSGFPRHRFFYPSYVQAEVGVPPHTDDTGVIDSCIEAIHPESRRAINDLVSRLYERPHDQIDQFVSPVPYHDTICACTHVLTERFSQGLLPRVRIDVVVRLSGQRFYSFGRRAIGVLVGVDLHDLLWAPAQLSAQHTERDNGSISFHVCDVGANEISYQWNHWSSPHHHPQNVFRWHARGPRVLPRPPFASRCP